MERKKRGKREEKKWKEKREIPHFYNALASLARENKGRGVGAESAERIGCQVSSPVDIQLATYTRHRRRAQRVVHLILIPRDSLSLSLLPWLPWSLWCWCCCWKMRERDQRTPSVKGEIRALVEKEGDLTLPFCGFAERDRNRESLLRAWFLLEAIWDSREFSFPRNQLYCFNRLIYL